MKIYEVADIILAQLDLEGQKRGSKAIFPTPKLLNKFIAEGEKEIQDRLKLIESDTDVTLLDSVFIYDLPSDFGTVNLRRMQVEHSNDISEFYIIYPVESKKQIQFIKTDNLNINSPFKIWYYPSINNYQEDLLRESPSTAPDIMLPDDTELALKYYVLWHIYPDYLDLYQNEMINLRSRRSTSIQTSASYDIGGLNA